MDITHDPITAGLVRTLATTPAASGASVWVSGAPYTAGKQAVSPTDYCQYICISATSDTTDPASNATKWHRFGQSAIKSIQRGSATEDTVITISEVNMSRTEVRYLGGGSVSGSSAARAGNHIRLISPTTLNVFCPYAGNYPGSAAVSWEITEYF